MFSWSPEWIRSHPALSILAVPRRRYPQYLWMCQHRCSFHDSPSQDAPYICWSAVRLSAVSVTWVGQTLHQYVAATNRYPSRFTIQAHTPPSNRWKAEIKRSCSEVFWCMTCWPLPGCFLPFVECCTKISFADANRWTDGLCFFKLQASIVCDANAAKRLNGIDAKQQIEIQRLPSHN